MSEKLIAKLVLLVAFALLGSGLEALGFGFTVGEAAGMSFMLALFFTDYLYVKNREAQ